MTTATKSPKTCKPVRSATLGSMSNGKTILWLSEDGEVKNGYVLTSVVSSFGTTYRLGKAEVGGCEEQYDVLLSGSRGSCNCKGYTYRSHCKHVEALQALIAAGKLPGPAAKNRPESMPLEDL